MNNEKKYETLAEFYKDFTGFRVSFKRLSIVHKTYKEIGNAYSAAMNDERVQFAKGIVYACYCVDLIDSEAYCYFNNVLDRYLSY